MDEASSTTTVADDVTVDGPRLHHQVGSRVDDDDDDDGQQLQLRFRTGRSSSRSRNHSGNWHRTNKLWQVYQTWVRENQNALCIADETITRLLFWTPSSSSSSSSSWREVIFGLLELHRLLLELATTTTSNDDDDGSSNSKYNDQCYGTSVAIRRPHNHFFPATAIRLGLTVLQSLWPVAQELARSSSFFSSSTNESSASSATSSNTRHQTTTTLLRQARVRMYMERMRFLLRWTLLLSYWCRILPEALTNDSGGGDSGGGRMCGLLLNGGLYHSPKGYGIEQERSRISRNNYVGPRTGRRLVWDRSDTNITKNSHGTWFQKKSDSVTALWKIIVGEMLYIIRPLLQAEMDVTAQHDASNTTTTTTTQFQTWLLCLFMDVASLMSLYECKQVGNVVTANEWRRRRLRLLLYLLRSPVWDRGTERTIHNVVCSTVIDKIPLVGKLLNNYIWDSIYYWKLYRAEEG